MIMRPKGTQFQLDTEAIDATGEEMAGDVD
jgi:hypothetical protein